MLEYIATLIGMHTVDVITPASAEENKPLVVQTAQPRPVYRVPRDQRLEAIRKRFAQQLKDDERTPDPYADMWDINWINKKD